jgi:D-alanyl-D-alanine carboxypeptidase
MEASNPFTPVYLPDSARMSPCRTAGSFSSQNLLPAPQVTANAWSILDIETGEFLWGKNCDVSSDIASLTKMMTCYLVNQCIKQQLISDQDLTIVPKDAALLGGTTAYLKPLDAIKVVDLMYGMMLPSGNDAAYALADYCGSVLMSRCAKDKGKYSNVNYFVKHMNIVSFKIGMKATKFLNPHGLSHLGNTSTAMGICKLAGKLMKNPLICKIVAQTKYSCEVINKGVPRKLTWNNTNFLLGKPGVTGLKTGSTNTAGPCLCATFNLSNRHIAVTLFKSRTPDKRWAEAQRLANWAINQLEIIQKKLTNNNIRVKNLSNLMNSFD